MKNIDKTHNLYIIKTTNGNSTLIKLGYSSNIIVRLYTYYCHNPLVEVLGTYYREDAVKFEEYFHKKYTSEILNEWYKEDMLEVMIEDIANLSEYSIEDLQKTNVNTNKYKSFPKACIEYFKLIQDNKLEDTKEILESYPVIEEAYKVLGEDKMKALKLQKLDIERELTTINKLNSNSLKILTLLDLQIGQWVAKSEVKDKIQMIYNELGINSTAKATDIIKWYDVLGKTKSINGINTQGVVINLSKFKK